MIWFLLGAAVTLGALDWSGGGGSRRYWVTAAGALGAFAFASAIPIPGPSGECAPDTGPICRGGFVAFAGLFACSTALSGIGCLFRRISVSSFVALGLSDVALLFGIWARHGESSLWSLPEQAGWGAASAWGAAAALLRLAAPMMASVRLPSRQAGDGEAVDQPERPAASAPRDDPARAVLEGGLTSIGWWEGALLAYWVGKPGAALLVAGGLLLWPAAAASRHRSAVMASAGGLVAIGAVLSVPAAGLAATGLGGVALFLGEPVVGLWAVGALPFSILGGADLTSFPHRYVTAGAQYRVYAFGCVAALPLAWAAVASRLQSSGAGIFGSGPVRAGATLASLAALAAALAWFDGERLGWALVAAGLAASGALRLCGGFAVFSASGPGNGADKDSEEGEGRRKTQQPPGGWSRSLARTSPGWGVLALVLGFLAWLFLQGSKTGFL